VVKRSRLVDLLKAHGIAFRLEGENVTPGWVGLDCPFCSDTNKHLGVKAEEEFFTCWRCRRSGKLFHLLEAKMRLPRDSVRQAMTEGQERDDSISLKAQVAAILRPEEPAVEHQDRVMRPLASLVPIQATAADSPVRRAVLAFLDARRFSWGVACANEASITFLEGMAGRLVLPVRDAHGSLVGYTGRSLFANLAPRYKNLGPLHETLYGIRSLKEGGEVWIVEGPLDQWRIGPPAVASFTKRLTAAQVGLLRSLRPSRVLVCWDGDAYLDAVQAARSLGVAGMEARAVRLPAEHDPDSLGRPGMEALVERLF
jgi:hypothetical protein